jgi:hypothetical protein
VLFIEHPCGNDKLIATGKKQLKLVSRLAGKRNAPNQCSYPPKLRMMQIVNRQRNMGSV